MNIQSSNYLLLHPVVSREIFNQRHFYDNLEYEYSQR